MFQEIIIFLFFCLLILGAVIGGGDIWLPSVLILGYVLLIWYRNTLDRERATFRNQLRSYRNELRQGGTVVVDQLLLRNETIVTTYQLTVGLILTSLTISSPYRVYSDNEAPEGLLYSAGSLLAGWWAFPSGPTRTIASLAQNLSGGRRETVASLLARRV